MSLEQEESFHDRAGYHYRKILSFPIALEIFIGERLKTSIYSLEATLRLLSDYEA